MQNVAAVLPARMRLREVLPDADAARRIDRQLAVRALDVRNCSGDASSNTNTTGDIPAGTSLKFLSSICAIVIGR